jgi:hypothetical protein
MHCDVGQQVEGHGDGDQPQRVHQGRGQQAKDHGDGGQINRNTMAEHSKQKATGVEASPKWNSGGRGQQAESHRG